MTNPPTLPELCAIAARWASANGINAVKLVIVQADGEQLPFKLGVVAERPSAQTAGVHIAHNSANSAKRKISKSYLRKILRAIPDADSAAVSSKTIARISGVKRNTHFFKALRKLILLEHVEEPARFKYKKTPK